MSGRRAHHTRLAGSGSNYQSLRLEPRSTDSKEFQSTSGFSSLLELPDIPAVLPFTPPSKPIFTYDYVASLDRCRDLPHYTSCKRPELRLRTV